MLVIHGGAGYPADEPAGRQSAYADALRAALEAGATALADRGEATAAVQAVVIELESCELFNAGRGSALCSDGSVQMSAALMRGSDGVAGAVAGVTRTEHPILAARCVFDSPQVLLIGGWADERAADAGLAQRPNEFFVTERQRARMVAGQSAGAPRGTVGAVCLDGHGILAAATSTGGVFGQPPGRVGDTPVVGAGTWADDRVAVSCTGDGEAFIRVGAARQIAALARSGMTLEEATSCVLEEIAAIGGSGGLIAVDWSGRTAAPFSTMTMPGGVWRDGSEPVVWVAEPRAPDAPGMHADVSTG